MTDILDPADGETMAATGTPPFEEAVARVLDHEGGFQCDPEDAGNWTGGRIGRGALKGTKYGISAAQYPALDIAGLTPAAAAAIYASDYWLRYRLDRLPPALAPKALDTAVLIGPQEAIRLLQQAVDAAGAPCASDGAIGPDTIAACRRAPAGRVLERYRALLVEHFVALAAANPGQRRFLAGWTRRALA